MIPTLMTSRFGPDDPGAADWRTYEDQVADRLQQMAGAEAVIEFNRKMLGRLSGSLRQIDVLVTGAFASGVITGVMLAVDCKCWNRNVTVGDVDRFAGMLDDIKIDLGLMVTTAGYSPAALERAQNTRGVKLEIVPYDELETWRPPLVMCPVCNSPDSDAFPGMAWLTRPLTDIIGYEFIDALGQCEVCSSPIWLCVCHTTNAVWEHAIGEWEPCDGMCGVEVRFRREKDRKGMTTGEEWEFRRLNLEDGQT